MMLRIDRHSVFVLATGDRIGANDGVSRRIDFRYFVGAAQIDIDLLLPHAIVLRHPRFAVELKCFDDRIPIHIDNRHPLAVGIGHIDPVLRRVGTAIGFSAVGRCQPRWHNRPAHDMGYFRTFKRDLLGTPDLEFQVIKYEGIEITAQNLSGDVTPAQSPTN
jgi:hypothetical protein